MTVREFYSQMGDDYDDVLRRLGSEALIIKVLGMLERDENAQVLKNALEAEDYDSAFRAAHTLKGIALNLGLHGLTQSASSLTEMLRGGERGEGIHKLAEETEREYLKVRTVWNGTEEFGAGGK